MEYTPMPIEKALKHMKAQKRIWNISNKVDNANALNKVILTYEKEIQEAVDRLWEGYNKVKFL